MKRLVVAAVLFGVAVNLQIGAQTLTVTCKNGTGAKIAAVMWITDSANGIQNSFALWDKKDQSHLKKWVSVRPNTTIDGTTGATPSSGATITGTWNCKGATGAFVPKGTYKFWIEVCVDGPTPQHAVGSIKCDGSSKTVSGADSGTSAYSTAITAISAVYTAGPPSSVTENLLPKPAASPLSFVTPAGSNSLRLRVITVNGRTLWQKNYIVSAGSEVAVSRNELSKAGASGICLLVADFGNGQIVRTFAGLQ
jgi:hypothetical protein